MLNDIVNGISIKLNETFGDGYEVYDEDVEQDLQEPCFFIKPLKATNKPLLGKRKQRAYPFDIAYFPKEGNEEMMQVADKMADNLEYITLLNGDVLRGLSIESEIVDGVLHFSIKYTVFLNDISKDDPMDTLESQVGTKKG